MIDRRMFAIVILAAGASKRMGRPKMVLPWADTTIVGHQIRQWILCGADQIALVCPPGPHPLLDELDRLGFPPEHRITNPHPENGMFSSIQEAARWPGWHENISHWVISLGDQPQLGRETLVRLLQAAARDPDPIWQPAWNQRPAHPVVLPARAFHQLARSQANNLKSFLHSQADALRLCYCEDPGLALDIDTPGDYEKLRSFQKKTP